MAREHSKYKILLLGPNDSLTKSIAVWLEEKAELLHLVDVSAVKTLISSTDLDLVILDIKASEINTLDIIQDIKRANINIPILIITENIKIDFILTAMQHHADGLLFKPLNKKKLIAQITQLMENARVKKNAQRKIILAIGAHPDDVEFGCSGTLCRLYEEAGQINILTLSLGSAGGIPAVRKQEAEFAAKLQHAQLFLGDFTDRRITNNDHTIRFIEEVVQTIKPTHVYTHSIHDNHQDHRNVYQATVIACRTIPNLFSYLAPSGTVAFSPSIFVNIDHYIEKKIEIISAYASQFSSKPYLDPDMIRATARYWGRFSNYALVEPMEVIKEQL